MNDGYTKKQSKALVEQIHRQYKGPYYYLDANPIDDAGPPKDFDLKGFLDTLSYDRAVRPVANLIALYKVFRRQQPSGRWALWITDGKPELPQSTMLMLDTNWLGKAAK